MLPAPRLGWLDVGGYLYSLATISILIALICAITPASGTAHVKLLCSLCVLCFLCTPILRVVDALGEGELEIPEEWIEQDEQEEQDLGQVAERVLAGQLQVLLEREFSLDPDECRVYSKWSDEGKITQVTVVLSGKAIWRDPDPIKEYVQELLSCPCVVVLD